mmetsp:Transcript_101785/g.265746  ORF Transcript_101785/g.265746 Transcript_101785/m.265746 type:complete len:294 (-) Transcript_101785:197-1078(-)
MAMGRAQSCRLQSMSQVLQSNLFSAPQSKRQQFQLKSFSTPATKLAPPRPPCGSPTPPLKSASTQPPPLGAKSKRSWTSVPGRTTSSQVPSVLSWAPTTPAMAAPTSRSNSWHSIAIRTPFVRTARRACPPMSMHGPWPTKSGTRPSLNRSSMTPDMAASSTTDAFSVKQKSAMQAARRLVYGIETQACSASSNACASLHGEAIGSSGPTRSTEACCTSSTEAASSGLASLKRLSASRTCSKPSPTALFQAGTNSLGTEPGTGGSNSSSATPLKLPQYPDWPCCGAILMTADM